MSVTESSVTASTATPAATIGRASLFVDGAPVAAAAADVVNPARLHEVVGTFARADAELTEAAVQAADRAFPAWSARTARDRSELLMAAVAEVEAELDALAVLLTREHGKVLADARAELANTVLTLRYYAGLHDHVDREIRRDDHRGRIIERRVPMGVVAVIVPWNYPVLLATLMFAPALMAGNTVVVKVPDHAPLTLSAVLTTIAATLPPGVANIVAGPGRVVGSQLIRHPRVRKVSFTGSTDTGKAIMRDASINLKNLGLELGGNDPAIVLAGAQIDEALVGGLVRGAFTSTGQVCYAPKRLYVHRSHFPDFVDAFTEAAGRLRIGDGLDPQVSMGPLNNRQQHEVVTDLVQASRDEGAQVRTVGEFVDVDEADGYFLRPTIVTGLTQQSRLVQEEQFGPAVPIVAFDTEDEVVALANDTEYGLAASVWSADVEHAFDLARRIHAGSVFVNIHRVGASDPSMPFGGFKQSGIGRGHGEIALDEASELQILADRSDLR
jgi:aldehyde dehydrogenase